MNAQPQSGFVTAVGWTFVVLGTLLLCIAVVQNLLFAAFAPFQADIASWEVFPPSARWVLVNLRWMLLANLALGVVTIAASIGLVRRREWARVVFVALMALGVAWNLGVAWLQYDFTSALQARVMATNPTDAGFSAFIILIRVLSFGFAATFCGLFGWIGYRLLQPDVGAEFRR